MRINSVRSGFLDFLSSCVVHILYFDDFHSTPHSLTTSQSVQKSPKWDTECCNWHLISQTHTSHLPTVSVVFLQNQKHLCQKKFIPGRVAQCVTSRLSDPFLGIGPGPIELVELAEFCPWAQYTQTGNWNTGKCKYWKYAVEAELSKLMYVED